MTHTHAEHKDIYLFGFPIAHSGAPSLHNLVFESIGSPCTYKLWSTSAVTQAVLDELRSASSGGAAVTMPLKAEIMKYLDEISPEGYATGACNTVVPVEVNGHRKLVGTNTDFLGVRNSLLAALGTQHPGVSVGTTATYAPGQASGMVIGGGATTRSAVHALYTLGMNPIFLANRDAAEVADTIAHFDSRSDPANPNRLRLIHLTSVEQVEGHLGPNATDRLPGIAMVVGAIPAIAPKSFEERMVYTIATHIFTLPFQPGNATGDLPIPSPRIFLDMAYKPRLTPLLKIAAALGWQDVGGVQAMIEQGLAQQRMWKMGSSSVAVASDESILDAETCRKARVFVENMTDIVPTEPEVDRAKTSV
ncbi:Aminoacid dehydrogenase-like protein [Cutaneotrichosporon oleaginosum]|uniref:Aminoacid dehydrogenase-like protein n=1 Tax=Cutaneotrichosporon oleaginosum TaxID=879819 RepID=A0A0J0XYJ6_9TREE|nr:Aminoacid dehydrogenase-like protein [Cutaneotrichosporon oleaginosum]KLT46132.1 Aminoacid dehydrogenase-like protein [Cutaneotrichosporon oleaginosum]TXT10142.1 hypothetical protein COLE_04076 [Cutaneotrichosporon oleaginosum]